MDLWLLNVGAHALQALLLVLGATLADRTLRATHPAARLIVWRTVLLAIVCLPFLQPWQSPTHPATAGALGEILELSAQASVGRAGAWNRPALLVALLAAGAVARLAWIFLGLARLRRLRHAADRLPAPPEPVLRAMADLQVWAEVRVTDDAGPVSFGIRAPVVILPRRFFEQDERSQYLIACHELLHVRRRDALHAFGEEVAFALLWYQPWIWWLRSHVRLAREQVVDRAVSRDRRTRESYVRTLLTMAGHRVPGLADAVAPRRRELRVRIDALYREVSMSRARLLVVVAASGVAVIALAIVAAAAFPLSGAPRPSPVATGGVRVNATAPLAIPEAPALRARPAAQEQEDEVVNVGGEIRPPAKTKHVNPVYPEDAKQAGIEGIVIIESVIGKDGKMASANVVRSIPELDAAALDAVLQWEFEPTYVKGRAVSVRMTITINFTLS
jgi:TonB family protein